MIEIWNRMALRYGRKRMSMLTLLIGIGLVSVVMRFLIFSNLFHSSLLYVLVPYCISVAITLFRPYDEPKSALRRFINHILTALSVLLSTSILLGEGFVCIVFFAPIYLAVISITYLFRYFSRDDNKYAFVLPVIVVALSLEGTSPFLSLPRETFVEVTRVTPLSVDQIKANLAMPFDLNKRRSWMISIFPMPYHVEAGSLRAGDVHTVYTRYHRWFVANTHEGQAKLLIESVEPNKIKTKVLSDTTYFSNYLQARGTEVNLLPLDAGGTEITLRLNYKRKLDPAWYFHPLQKLGMSQMGELIIDQLMVRG